MSLGLEVLLHLPQVRDALCFVLPLSVSFKDFDPERGQGRGVEAAFDSDLPLVAAVPSPGMTKDTSSRLSCLLREDQRRAESGCEFLYVLCYRVRECILCSLASSHLSSLLTVVWATVLSLVSRSVSKPARAPVAF